eukprot:CAMPEP_0119393472 /NCGR_PEP_ID=MMETSP1334-20130426/125473_1 /TAXON_ID=127549 /ORGANISM="Calcidiscus leptoporus, Strain RCC1130" /LENGTH=104 /DNA_ID=CAMNT_0007416545 /DNA_START=70 /DNA_END=381 /DNA_ORIENTATION=+
MMLSKRRRTRMLPLHKCKAPTYTYGTASTWLHQVVGTGGVSIAEQSQRMLLIFVDLGPTSGPHSDAAWRLLLYWSLDLSAAPASGDSKLYQRRLRTGGTAAATA